MCKHKSDDASNERAHLYNIAIKMIYNVNKEIQTDSI